MTQLRNKWSCWLKISVICPEPESFLWELSKKGITTYDVSRPEGLTLVFNVDSNHWPTLKSVAEKMGCEWKILGRFGMRYFARKLLSRRMLLFGLAFLLFLSIFSSGRIFSVRVEGNDVIPSALIIEAAEAAGLSFGANAGAVRSEELKNRLLEQIDSLEWVGVNTSGCVATIRVRERKRESQPKTAPVGHIVAAVDGIVDQANVTAGTLLCKIGESVKNGQILITGLQDLGICTRAVAAEGEIYGITRRELQAVLPAEQAKAEPTGQMFEKYSLIIGKKRINLSSDSGILMPGCGKMTERKSLCLFGGITLPVGWTVERYQPAQICKQEREPNASRSILEEACQRYLRAAMISGRVLSCDMYEEDTEDHLFLTAVYDCREMIGIRRAVGDLEGITYDNG